MEENQSMSVEEAIVLIKNEIDMQKGIGVFGAITSFIQNNQDRLQAAFNDLLKKKGNLSPDESKRVMELLEEEKSKRAKAEARKTKIVLVAVALGLVTAGYFIYKKSRK